MERSEDGRVAGVRRINQMCFSLLLAATVLGAHRSATADGFLTGKHVYLSAGHGWYYNGQYDAWMVQRGNTNNIVEDLYNTESVSNYLVQYLRNAGATVWPCREADPNPRMVIVDDQDASARPDNGVYAESGAWATATGGGFVNFKWPYHDGDAVFAAYASGGRNRTASLASPATAIAAWTPNIPSAGYYNVAVSYTSSPTSAIAHYIVRHTGGLSHLYINQARHGSTWVPLGRFYFAAGSHTLSGSVMLLNDGAGSGTVSADAVRFGGGPGIVDRGSGTSGYPQFEEAGRYFTFFSGAPTSVYNYISSCYDAQTGCGAGDDASARPRYAAWQHVADEDALYLSWHSNAGGGRGTSSFYHSTLAADSPSAVLTTLIHNQMLLGIRSGFDPSWTDRGVGTLEVGELSPGNNPEMPAALIEVAFHDDATDANYLRNPRFRQAVARSVYQGMAKYFAARDGAAPAMLPEPPQGLSVGSDGSGRVRLSWQAGPSGDPLGDPASGYLVYRSSDGKGFDTGRATVAASFIDTQVSAGQVWYYRVAATNAGGVSLPTETLAVRVAPAGSRGKMLIVNGYDRVDRTLVPLKPSGRSIASPARERPEWVNTFDYVIQHAQSIAPLGIDFDSASNEAVASGAVALQPYALVDWIGGRQANSVTEQPTDFTSFSASERAIVRSYAEGGGHLLVSGAEILYDLDRNADTTDAESLFVREVFKVAYGGDDANTYNVTGSAVPFTPLPAPPPITPGGAASYALSTGTLYIPDGYQPPLDNADIMVHFHGAESVARDNLLQSGKSAVLIVINYGGLSAAYSGPFSDRHLFRTVLMEARARMSEVYGREIGIGKLALTSFSAGYGAVREILKYPEYNSMVTDVVLGDSLYAGYVTVNGQSVPNPDQLKEFIEMARRAVYSRSSFTLTHSQVFPGTYASTRECADAIIAAVGASRVAASGADATGMTLESTATSGLFRIRSYAGATGDDHMMHLHQLQEALKLTSFPDVVSNGTYSFSNGSGDMYDVAYPDRVVTNGGWIAQTYSGGTADGAAAVFSGDRRVVFMGYPFETLLTKDASDSVMQDAMRFLLPPPETVTIGWGGIPAQLQPGQNLYIQLGLTSSLDFPMNLDVWASLTSASGEQNYVYDLVRNQPIAASATATVPVTITAPFGAPAGPYTLSLFAGDFQRHVIGQTSAAAVMAASSQVYDDFSGTSLDNTKWLLAGALGGAPSVAGGKLVLAYSPTGAYSGVDLLSAQAYTGSISVSASVAPVQPASGTHTCGISLVTSYYLPDTAPTAKLLIETTPSGGRKLLWKVKLSGGSEMVQETPISGTGPVTLSVWRSTSQVSASYDDGSGLKTLTSRTFPIGSAYGWLFAFGGPGAGEAAFDWAAMGGQTPMAHPVSQGPLGQMKLAPLDRAWQITAHVSAGAGDLAQAVQSPDRSAGIHVNWKAAADLPVPDRRTVTSVFGRIAAVDGQGVLQPFRYVSAGTAPPEALGANSETLAASAGPSTDGLLMRLAGRVASVDQQQQSFVISDGGWPVSVRCPGLTMPAAATFVTVTGIVSDAGTSIRPRNQSDITVH